MDSLINDFPARLLGEHGSPCLSLYQPTHRQFPDSQQNQIRFRNLVRSIEESLSQKYPAIESGPLLAPFRELANSHSFWRNPLDGLVVLGAPEISRVYKLQRPVPEIVVTSDSFHVKPLMRIVQSADRYQVLALTRHEVKLYQGNRDALDEIDLAAGVPRTITDALGSQLTEAHQNVGLHSTGSGGATIHHGQGGRSDEVDIDEERFFRVIDRSICEHHSRATGLPLLLIALPEHQARFRQLSHNPFLMPESIEVHPDSISAQDLRQRVWHVIEPRYIARLAGLVETFGTARAQGLGADNLESVAEAAAAGRIATLLVEADRVVPGRFDPTTGLLEPDDISHTGTNDILDDIAETVARMKGVVVVVPTQRMPTTTGLAATFRF